MIFFRLIVFIFIFPNSSILFAEIIETNKISIVKDKINEILKKYAARDVLFVTDIDNTMLAMDGDLGSDAWFLWQENMLFSKNKSDKKGLITKNFDALLKAQGLLFDNFKMHTPEKNTSKIIIDIQKLNVPTFALTSRGKEFENATQKELKQNNLSFENSWRLMLNPKSLKLKELKELEKPWLPYEPSTVQKSFNFSQKEVLSFKLDKKSRPITFSKGVFYTAGQHKGVMLRIITSKFKYTPKTVIFLDDSLKHVQRVNEAMTNIGIQTYSYRYSKEDENVKRFNASDKSEVTKDWSNFIKSSKKKIAL